MQGSRRCDLVIVGVSELRSFSASPFSHCLLNPNRRRPCQFNLSTNSYGRGQLCRRVGRKKGSPLQGQRSVWQREQARNRTQRYSSRASMLAVSCGRWTTRPQAQVNRGEGWADLRESSRRAPSAKRRTRRESTPRPASPWPIRLVRQAVKSSPLSSPGR